MSMKGSVNSIDLFCLALLCPSRFAFLYHRRDSALNPFPICVNLRASAVKIIGASVTPVSINNPANLPPPKADLGPLMSNLSGIMSRLKLNISTLA